MNKETSKTEEKDKRTDQPQKSEVKTEVQEKKETVKSEKPSESPSGDKKPNTRKFVNKKFDTKRGGKNNKRNHGNKPRSEYDQKIISLRRVTRVVAGGRRFSFSVGIVIGDRNGSVGVGLGKANDTALAIEKAMKDAKKSMITPNLTESKSIPYDIDAKYCASRVMMVPTPGKGLKAGGAMRTILDLLGAKDVSGKILSRSKNHVNNARATIKALEKVGVRSPVKVSVNSEKEKVSVK